MSREIFDSSIGKITVITDPYCAGCKGFQPRTDKLLRGGLFIQCEHKLRCQSMMRYLREKSKGEINNAEN